MEVKDVVRFLRNEAGLTVEKAAFLADVTRRTWTNWEAGASKPTNSVLEAFCHKAGVNMQQILSSEFGVSRPVPVGRTRKRLFQGETAIRALRGCEWGKGREMFGFTKGQFSFVDLIEAATEYTGDVDATIATWTAANADLSRIDNFLKRNRLRSVQWVVDYSFETRQPKFCAQLRETFGDESIRTVPSHCKYVLLSNDDWHVVIQTSMNLNQNARLENFWIADDEELFSEYKAVADELFQTQKPGEGFGNKPSVRRAEFGVFGEGRKSSFFDVKKGAELI